MKKSNLFISTVAALFSFIQIGCEGGNPAAVPPVPRNSQPVVKDISDETLEDGDSTTVKVRIEDEDEDDIHTINATCEDQGVALSSIEDETITIRAIGVGVTTCTVYATDSSGQDNSKSESVPFQITVTAPPISLGKCQVGMKVQSGESCFYFARDLKVTFSVRPDGLACRESDKPYTKTTEVFGISATVTLRDLCVSGYDIRGDDAFDTNFSADQNSDGSWTIRVVP